MDPLVASALIGGAAQLGSGFLSSPASSSGADWASVSLANKTNIAEARKARKWQVAVMKQQVRWRVQDAIKAGIHPLAALGINPASGSAPIADMQVGGGSSRGGRDMSFIGDTVKQVLKDMDPTTKRMAKTAADIQEQELLGKQLENISLAKEAFKSPTGRRTGVDEYGRISEEYTADSPIPGIRYVDRDLPYSDQSGGASVGTGPFFDKYRDPEGNVSYLPNQNTQDLVSESFVPSMRYQIPDVVDYVYGMVKGKPYTQRGKSLWRSDVPMQWNKAMGQYKEILPQKGMKWVKTKYGWKEVWR